MASKYYFETRDERIERMFRDNPGRPIQLCTAVVDGIWDKTRELIDSRIPERFEDASIEDLGYLSDQVVESVKEVFASPDKNDKVGIVFCGPAGSGKTHAAYAVVNMIKEKNPEMIAFMAGYPSAMSSLKNEYANGSYEEMGSMWDRLTNESGMYDGLLVVDDLSSQKLTDFEIDKIMMFLEKRLNSYMPFLITTNVKMEDFKEVFGERLASRLLGYCTVVEFEERDKRLEKKII